MPFISPALQTLLVEAFWETAGMVGLSAVVAAGTRSALSRPMPIADAASYCPLSTDSMPARITSEV